MNMLTPVAQGFLEALQLIKALVWIVPKATVILLYTVVLEFIRNKPVDQDHILKRG